MSTRIDITVITRSLRQFAKQVMANNRRAQLQKESDRRTEAEAKRKREKKVAAEVPWHGAVPEGGIKTELAAFRDAQTLGVGNAWFWTAGRISKFRSYGDIGLNTFGAPSIGIVAIEEDNKIGSIDGTSWIEWTDVFDASNIVVEPSSTPLPASPEWASPSWTLYDHRKSLRPQTWVFMSPLNFQRDTRGSLMSAGLQLVLPVGPQSMVFVNMKRFTFGYQACVQSIYAFTVDGVADPDNLRSVFEFSDTLQTKTVTAQKAFIVGNSTIREITLPASLASTLWDMMPTHTPSIEYVDHDFSTSLDFTINYHEAAYGVVSVPRITWTTTPPVNTDSAWLTDHTYDAPRTAGIYNNPSELPGLEIVQFSSSASVYPSLIHGSTWEADGDDPQATRVKQKAIPTFPLNFGAFAGLSALVAPRQPIDFLYANGGDLYFNGALNSLSESRTPRPETNPPTFSYSDDEDNVRTSSWESRLYTSSDWADARFCRQRLLALGFSPSDLTP